MQFSQASTKLKTFLLESRRVLSVTRKPSKEEFLTTVKVTGIGIIVIGLIGFLLTIGKNLIISS